MSQSHCMLEQLLGKQIIECHVHFVITECFIVMNKLEIISAHLLLASPMSKTVATAFEGRSIDEVCNENTLCEIVCKPIA